MTNEELYDKLIEAYQENDENHFAAAARNWVENAENAPFKNEEANALLGSAKHHRNLWISGGISSRVSKIRMIECVRKIMEMDIDNPYCEPIIAKEKHEPKHILGVIPEIKSEPEIIPEEKPAEKHIFKRKRK